MMHSSQLQSRRYAQHGVSLIQLMVAMLVALFLIGGALSLFSESARNFRAQEAMARLMDNGRVAMELMARDLRLAGYWGCSGWEVANLSNHLGSNQRGIYGADGGDGPDLIRSIHAEDQVHNQAPWSVQDDYDPLVSDSIDIGGDHDITVQDLVLVNDCTTGDVFNLKAVGASTVSPCCTKTHGDTSCGSSSCFQAYKANAAVYKVRDRIYFIGTGVNGHPSLFQCQGRVNEDRCVAGSREELIEGVEDMQVYFGEDSDGDGVANRYVTADVINAPCAEGSNPDCWARVASLRISLLMRSLEDNIAGGPQRYIYDGSMVTAADKHLRREYSAIIWLRNHRS